MFKHLLTIICLLTVSGLYAQLRFQDELVWDESPQIIEWEGIRSISFSHSILSTESASSVNAGRRSAGARFTSRRPVYLRQFAAAPNREYRVEVVSANFESFSLPSGTEDFPSSFDFSVSTTQQPEGWIGLVSAPAIISTPTGPQRLISLDIRLIPTGGRGLGRMDFATTSVLSQGQWFRVSVTQPGIHRISGDFLASELGIDLGAINPRSLAIFGQSSSGKLPEPIEEEAPDDLTEMAIQVIGEEDGSFDGGDAILFYAEGPDQLHYESSQDRFFYEKNVYATENYYYLRVGGANGRRVSELPAANATTTTDSYDAFYHFEEDRFNVLHELGGNSHGSGQQWFGEFFKVSREKNYPALFRVPQAIPGEPAELRAQMALRTDVTNRFFIEVQGQRITSRSGSSVRFGRQEQLPAARPTELVGDISLTSPEVDVLVDYPFPGNANNSEGWLDWIQLRARRQLTFPGEDQFNFRDTRTMDAPAVSFQLGNFPSDGIVWRVDGADVRQATVANGSFNAPAGGNLFEYVAFRPGGNLPSPASAERVDNQNLHSIERADMIIVCHPTFLTQAEQLAEHRRSHNGLEVVVATTEQVYHEFSSGRPDAAAIRNFAHMIYRRDPELRYLLLFGDGSFDHRNILGLGTTFIPAFEHSGNITEVGSFPADDFFGIFNPTAAGQPLGPMLNIAVGRLPVKSGDEANQVVAKLIRYDTEPATLGDWRTRMVFAGDDEDGGTHARDVNTVANAVAARKPDLNFDKLYFDLFPQQSLSAGDRYPDVTEGLDRAIFRGALAVTYLGHGGPRGWAQERVLTIPQIRNWTREPNAIDPIQPPVFITATCTFSNYDDASFVSAGEEALLTPNGGVIALLTTTRPVFANRNFQLTNETVQAMMDRPDGEWRSLGDIIRIAKNRAMGVDSGTRLDGRTENVRKFTLLGDPATVIALPRHSIRTTMIDSLPVTAERQDTVRALQKMRISGEITDVAGNLLENFNGQVFPTIYDKPQTVTTLAQDPGSPQLEFSVQRNIVFRGRATVTNGRFSFEFVVPNDINYSFGAGKISYYAADPNQFTDAAGFYDRLIIGGTSSSAVTDNQGPAVNVFMDTEDFVAGSQTTKDPVLLVKLSDDLGINVTGNSIGHDLEAVLDEDTRNAIVLNDYYEADADDFRSGTVRYPLFDLEPGPHTVTVRAWDVANNSAIGQTDFVVAADGNDALTRVLNYPNPFTDRTCFQFDHTLIGQEVEAIVQIYTINGRLVKTLTRDYPFSDGTVRQDDCIEWDGLDDYGDPLARGVYLYQVRLRGDQTNVIDGELEKLVILK
jgi:antitoxin (DNA-binding transcriptional repressor) of toxin-antitoxin stability system